jgi:uncharacterized protein (TIGR03086 family)
MDPKELFRKSIEEAWGCVRSVHENDLPDPTPCTEWDLRTLLNHVVNELLWVPELLAGKTIAEVGDRLDGDLLGSDAPAAYRSAADKALAAAEAADPESIVHLSYGDFPASHYIAEVGSDVLIHGWDVGQAIHCSQIFEPEVAQAAYDQLAPHIRNYRDAGLVADAIEVSEDAPIQTRLLALAGRRVPSLESITD